MNKTRIEQNTRDIAEIRDDQLRYAKETDNRLRGVEEKVANLASLLEGGAASLPPGCGKYNYETEHEKQLHALIEQAKSMVTVLGFEDPSPTAQTVAIALTKAGFHLPGPAARVIISACKLGNPTSNSAPLKVQLDSQGSAEMLIEQSRSKSRTLKDSGRDGSSGLRVVKHYPQPYAQAAKDFRQMAAQIFENGGLAHMEYEGNTLTLRGKSREIGGQWVIVRGCTFKPVAVGRPVPWDGETPEESSARVLLDKLVDNQRTSISARTLFFRTKEDLGTIKQMTKYLGNVLSEDLEKVEPCKSTSRGKYTLVYASREAALAALHKSRHAKDLITSLDKDHDWLLPKLTVVSEVE